MRPGQFASTARGVALLRALEMTRPAPQRLCADPYAKKFVNPLTLFGLRLWQALRLDRATGIAPMMTFALARERYVHELMLAEASAGLEQVVILGAGFDTRAYRTPELGTLRVFEVDHPLTQAAKLEALRGVVAPPQNVTFVAVDFDRTDLGEALSAAGYDPAARTLFVWQGVTVYLTPAGIDATLGFIARRSGPGSAVVFDYIDSAILNDRAMSMLRLFTRALGEAMSFGIAASDLTAKLEGLGFASVDTIEGPALARLYPAIGDRPMAVGVGIATARVPGAGTSAAP